MRLVDLLLFHFSITVCTSREMSCPIAARNIETVMADPTTTTSNTFHILRKNALMPKAYSLSAISRVKMVRKTFSPPSRSNAMKIALARMARSKMLRKYLCFMREMARLEGVER